MDDGNRCWLLTPNMPMNSASSIKPSCSESVAKSFPLAMVVLEVEQDHTPRFSALVDLKSFTKCIKNMYGTYI